MYSHGPQSYIGKKVSVIMDRIKGSKHPEHGFVYEVNYGYVPGTYAPDKEAIDAYVLGVDDPVEKFQGTCIAVVHRENDNDDKLIVVPEGMALSDDEIMRQVAFQEKWFNSTILRD